MDPTEDAHTDPSGARRDRWQLAAAAILEGLPDAVVAAAHDGRILFVNALAEKLFGYSREELLGQPVQTLWPERVRERYTGNMELYFESEHPLRFSNEAWGLRGDGSEFVGEMSWGVVETTTGPLSSNRESRTDSPAGFGSSKSGALAPRRRAWRSIPESTSSSTPAISGSITSLGMFGKTLV